MAQVEGASVHRPLLLDTKAEILCHQFQLGRPPQTVAVPPPALGSHLDGECFQAAVLLVEDPARGLLTLHEIPTEQTIAQPGTTPGPPRDAELLQGASTLVAIPVAGPSEDSSRAHRLHPLLSGRAPWPRSPPRAGREGWAPEAGCAGGVGPLPRAPRRDCLPSPTERAQSPTTRVPTEERSRAALHGRWTAPEMGAHGPDPHLEGKEARRPRSTRGRPRSAGRGPGTTRRSCRACPAATGPANPADRGFRARVMLRCCC